MLKQLEHLSISADGRYATGKELQFIKNYAPTVDLRIQTYQKVRDGEKQIIEQLIQQVAELKPNIFHHKAQDIQPICRRDLRIILRSVVAAILIDDLDRLREDMLLWQRTIVKAFHIREVTTLIYNTLPEVIQQCLTSEEFAVMEPALELIKAILAAQ